MCLRIFPERINWAESCLNVNIPSHGLGILVGIKGRKGKGGRVHVVPFLHILIG